MNVSTTTSALVAAGGSLLTSLGAIATSVTQLDSDCRDAVANSGNNPQLMDICNQITPASAFVAGINFTAVS